MLSSRMKVDLHHPYTGSLVGPGRWFVAYSFEAEPMGFVWTDDISGLGQLLTTDKYETQTVVEWFGHARNYWGASGTSATDAFESFYEMQEMWAPEGTVVSSGDLKLDLWDKEMATDRNYVEYGLTVRDDGEVLELLRHDPTGSYIRENGSWELVDPEADEDMYPTVYGQEWHEVDEDIVEFYDQNSSSAAITVQDIQVYII